MCYANHFAVGIFSADMSGNEATSCTGPFLIALGVFDFPFFFFLFEIGHVQKRQGLRPPLESNINIQQGIFSFFFYSSKRESVAQLFPPGLPV